MTRGHLRPNQRGLSTAANLLVMFVALYLALGSLQAATTNTGERVREAVDAQRELRSAVIATNLSISSAVWEADPNESVTNLTVRVNNSGDRTVDLDAVDTLVDGTYIAIADYERVQVDGRQRDLWRPGEALVLRDQDTVDERVGSPDRLKIITDVGVAAGRKVTTT